MVGWIGAAGAVLFVVVFLIDGATRPDYSPQHHTVSALATGPRGWTQTANFLVSGAAIVTAAVGLIVTGQSVLLGYAVAVFGLGLVASGVFPMDPMRGYPPGTPNRDPHSFSRRHHWHDNAGAVVFFSLPLIVGVVIFVGPGVGWLVASVIVLVALIWALVAFNKAWENDLPHTGLVQRVFLGLGMLWLAAVFAHFALLAG